MLNYVVASLRREEMSAGTYSLFLLSLLNLLPLMNISWRNSSYLFKGMTPFSGFRLIITCVIVFLNRTNDEFTQFHHVISVIGLPFRRLGFREDNLLLLRVVVMMIMMMIVRRVLLVGIGACEEGCD